MGGRFDDEYRGNFGMGKSVFTGFDKEANSIEAFPEKREMLTL